MPHLRFVPANRTAGVVAATALALVLLLSATAFAKATKVVPLASQVTSPVRIAWTPKGDLLLSDYQTRSVLVVDPQQQVVRSKIVINGRPTGVTADNAHIFIGNETTGNIEVYTPQGKLHATWGNGAIGLPNDMAIDANAGHLFVVDAKAHQVLIFDRKGDGIGAIPAAGASQQLDNPTALTLDPKAGLVYVSDQGPSTDRLSFRNHNAFVRIYRYDGSYVDSLSGAFTRPQGLTLNQDGYLYLADAMLGQVLVYDTLSKGLVKTVGSFGLGPGQLSLPLDVAIDPGTGDLLVTNNRAGRLEIFAEGGIAP